MRKLEKLKKISIARSTNHIPLNFFNAIESPFTKGILKENKCNEDHYEPERISCTLINDHNMFPGFFYKNITSIVHDIE